MKVLNMIEDIEIEDGEIIDELENEIYEDISSDEEINLRERIKRLEEENWEIERNNSFSDRNYGNRSSMSSISRYTLSTLSDYDVFEYTPPIYRPTPIKQKIASPKILKRKIKVTNNRQKKMTKKRRSDFKVKSNVSRYLSTSDSEEDIREQKHLLNLAVKVVNHSKIGNDINELKKKLKICKPNTINPILQCDSPIKIVEEEDDELHLRLIALNSKQEMRNTVQKDTREITGDIGSVINHSNDTIDNKIEDTLNEENELRLLALKSTFRKKHEARKKRKENERPYSPTDIVLEGVDMKTLTNTIKHFDNDNGSNMEISPISSPRLLIRVSEDSVTNEIDMDLASEDSSNYSVIMREKSPPPLPPLPVPPPLPLTSYLNKFTTDVNDLGFFDNMSSSDAKLNLENVSCPSYHLPIAIKNDKLFVDNYLQRQNKNVYTKNIESNQTSRCDLFQNLMNNNNIDNDSSKDVIQTQGDEEEEALRTLLLSRLAANMKSSKNHDGKAIDNHVVDDKLSDENSLDALCLQMKTNEVSINNTSAPEIQLSLKRAVQRINERKKLAEEKAKRASSVVIEDNGHGVAIDRGIIPNEKKANNMALEVKKSSIGIKTIIHTNNNISVTFAEDNNIVSNKENKCEELQMKNNTLTKKVNGLEKDQIKAEVKLPKRKLGITSDNIPLKKFKINEIVPKNNKQNATILPTIAAKTQKMVIKPNVNSVSANRRITNVDDCIKPVAKLIIKLGKSDAESDTSFLSTDVDNSVGGPTELYQIKHTDSPSHIIYDSPASSPMVNSIGNEIPTHEVEFKNDVEHTKFENKLNQFLKTARTKIEPPIETYSPTRNEIKKKTVISPIKAPSNSPNSSAVCHLPISSQLEYKRLKARIDILEKQKQIKLNKIATPRKVTHCGLKITVNNELAIGDNSLKRNLLVRKTFLNTVPENDIHIDKIATEKSNDIEFKNNETDLVTLNTVEQRSRKQFLKKYEDSYILHSNLLLKDATNLLIEVKRAQRLVHEESDLQKEVIAVKKRLNELLVQIDDTEENIKNIFPTIKTSQKKIIFSHRKSIALNKICMTYGKNLDGDNYELPRTNDQILRQKLELLVSESKKFNKLKIDYLRKTVPAQSVSTTRRIVIAPPDIHSNNLNVSNSIVNTGSSNSVNYGNGWTYSNAEGDSSSEHMEQFEQIDEDDPMSVSPRMNYATPLNWLGEKPNSDLTDINAILCPYALGGECNDKDCFFGHIGSPQQKSMNNIEQ